MKQVFGEWAEITFLFWVRVCLCAYAYLCTCLSVWHTACLCTHKWLGEPVYVCF